VSALLVRSVVLAQTGFPDRAWLGNPRNWERLAGHAVEHVQLTLAGVVLGLAVAFPLALLARRRPRLYTPLLVGTGLLYTIPSLAMFLLIAAFLQTGFGFTTAVIGLALYSVLILFRNTVAGLDAVPGDIREAGEAMGYTSGQLLVRVELPIALPVVIAGLRIALVTTIGLVTITSLTGMGGIGRLFITGFQRQNTTILAVAIVAVVILAVAGDLLLVALQRRLLPWARARETA
jgi:osmoprotectant transport system permease protein